MGQNAYYKCLIHMTWATKNREPVLERDVRKRFSKYLYTYSKEKEIYMYGNYLNAEHVHVLFDLPASKTLQEVAKLFKGSSSFEINKNRWTSFKFRWGRGYGAFSVSPSNLDKVKSYIKNQEKYHRDKSFNEELNEFLKAYGLENDSKIRKN